VCTDFVCSNPPLYNTATHCCNPAVGPSATTLIDDGDDCTIDVCDPATGIVAHNPRTCSDCCDDGFDCTVDDGCDAGVCSGTDVNTIPCPNGDSDCPLGTCGTAVAGFCECSETTPLCVVALDKHCSISQAFCQTDSDCGSAGGVCVGDYPDGNCFDPGADVNMGIHIGAGSQCVSGGQFLMTYDPTCLDFQSIGPCAGSIYTNVIQVDVDEVAGEIFYAVSSDVATQANECSPGPADMGCIVFKKTLDCDACDVCLIDRNPKLTILTNDQGNRVPTDNCGCSKDLRLAGDIDLDTPPGASVNADCNRPVANITWPTPSATDSCEGPLVVTCNSQHVGGLNIAGLINNGGNIPQGKSFFKCTASNTCGKVVTNVWTVMVSDQHSLDVEVHLCPVINNAGLIRRAITFELFFDCSSGPTEECCVMDFQGPYNFLGHGTCSLKVDKNNFACITARDNLHTLRSVSDVECVNNRWTAIFKGDAHFGGNCLIGGNLDAKKAGAVYGDMNTINILDFGVFMAQLAAKPNYEPNGDTDCQTAYPHGDINADGAVDNLDYATIVENFLKNSKGACCPAPPGNFEANPITEVSVKDLRRMGYTEAVIADLNKDGVLNLEDMAAYMQGVVPVEEVKPVREGKGRGTR
jgi:hypothetical protein